MPFAFQTICWGSKIDEHQWPSLFQFLYQAGYRGVEIFQPVNTLPPYAELLRFAREAGPEGLRILGFTGGSLPLRREYLRDSLDATPTSLRPYLYTELWDSECDAAQAEGFRLALHFNHLKTLDGIDDVRRLLREHDQLGWLPDTAHLYIGARNFEDLLAIIRDPLLLSRTTALHLKDWTAKHGKFSHRYAKGFGPLGEGDIDLKRLLAEWSRVAPDAWTVVEVDYAPGPPEDVALAAARYLREIGVQQLAVSDSEFRVPSEFEPEEFHARQIIQLASLGLAGFFNELAKTLQIHDHAAGVRLLSFASAVHQVPTLASVGVPEALRSDPARKAIDHLAKRSAGNGQPETLFLDCWRVSTQPIFNRFNPNQVRLLILYFDETAPGRAPSPRKPDPVWLRELALAAELYITERCAQAAAIATSVGRNYDQPEEYLSNLASELRDFIGCQGVTIFRAVPFQRKLVVGGTTGIRWRAGLDKPSQKAYPFGIGLTGRAASSRRYMIHQLSRFSDRASGNRPGRSWEIVANSDEDSGLIVPFFDSRGEVAGVVRCRNRVLEESTIGYFSEDDLAQVEAFFQAASPLVEALSKDKARADAVNLLSHELSQLITALKASVETLADETLRYENANNVKVFRYDYFDEMNSWLHLMVRQMRQFELFTPAGAAEWTPRRGEWFFYADILLPLVDQVKPILENNGFGVTRINVGTKSDWQAIPRLHIDRNLFEQVVFNLLMNAIKYAKPDPKEFSVRIRADRRGREVLIHFEDYGIGIQDGWEEEIFQQGSRIEEPQTTRKPGLGLGLWVVRKIVVAHGGEIRCTSNRNPTRFTITLRPR